MQIFSGKYPEKKEKRSKTVKGFDLEYYYGEILYDHFFFFSILLSFYVTKKITTKMRVVKKH